MKHRLTDIDEGTRNATCSVCGLIRISSKGKGKWRCPSTEKSKLHGLTRDKVAEMKKGASCKICGSTKLLRIDHDHATGEIRGVLCHNCNVALGLMGDSPDRLRDAARYLER